MDARELTRLVRRFDDERRLRGLGAAVSQACDVAWGYLGFSWYPTNRHPESFVVGGRELAYFRHPYNRAWRNERSVELALAFDFLAGADGQRVLELGNVTVHYGAPPHDVVDKYEDHPGVMNLDIVDFQAEPYPAVLSISTLEHVGWDEEPRRPDKVEEAYGKLLSLVAPGGRLLVTCPLGHNPHLDALVLEDRLPNSETTFLKRVSRHNLWVEVPAEAVAGSRYGSPFPNANAIFVGRYTAPA